MERAGLKCLAAIDFNKEAIAVFKHNFPNVPVVIEKDLTKFSPAELKEIILKSPDIIIGGPPCQGFSTARQVDGSNHGVRIKDDARRYLYREYLNYVKYFKPKLFVMENVLGIRSASDGKYYKMVQNEAREIGYRVHTQVENCVELGLPQKRRRQLFIGTSLDLPEYFIPNFKSAPRASKNPSLWEAIGDLPSLMAGEGTETSEYDLKLRSAHQKKFGRKYLFDVLEVNKSPKLTAHRARPHSLRDLQDFLLIREGENSKEAMDRGVNFLFPYSKESFKDRYTRQHRKEACSTIVAHLSKDGLMFIHPTQNRSLTPREAARIQSFPDWFGFPVARTHQFRVIGNAVPPLVAESIGIVLKSYMKKNMNLAKAEKSLRGTLPKNDDEALKLLTVLIKASEQKLLHKIDLKEFKRGWHAICFLYPGLHPDAALEHGSEISHELKDENYSRIDAQLRYSYYVQSGWPVILAPIVKEAWKRYETEELSDDEFYCSAAVIAGMHARNNTN